MTRLRLCLLWICVALLPQGLLLAGIEGDDDFNDNTKDLSKWGPDITYNTGLLAEVNKRIEFHVPTPTTGDEDISYRPWILNEATYDTDWEVILDVHNSIAPTIVDQVATIGLEVFNSNDLTDSVYLEIYSSALDTLPWRRGIHAGIYVDDTEIGLADSMHVLITDAAIRLVFDGQSKTFSLYYDLNGSTNGYSWTRLVSFGIAGAGGDENGDWAMSGNDTFAVAVFGYTSDIAVSPGQLYADNFSALTAPVQPPVLEAALSGDCLSLKWPRSALGYVLQKSYSLSFPDWSDVWSSPVLSNACYHLDVPITDDERYYRLRKPAAP